MNKLKIANIIILSAVAIGFGICAVQYSELNNKYNKAIVKCGELHDELKIYKLLIDVDNDTVKRFIISNNLDTCDAKEVIEYSIELEQENKEITTVELENYLEETRNLRLDNFILKKPVIYVYNTTGKTEIQLTLNNTSTMEVEYPKHDELINNTYIWNVDTSMDGKLRTGDNEEYNYIFWEANTNEFNQQEFKDGFCVKGENTEKFLKESLKELNLTPTEYNDFIVYWLPQMQNNNYNIIRFCGIDESDTDDTYLKETQLAVYNNNKVIENQLRVMMLWYSSDEPIEIKEQNLKEFAIARDNTTPTVIEWGGEQINK